jgi:tyrosyl-tRNA synthetase
MPERIGLLADLQARDLIQGSTDVDALAARLDEGPISLYYGCDPTADSLHVGNLIGLAILRRFQDAGHRPIALAGGATGMVGDPSGRSDERNLLDEATLARNVAAIKEQMSRIVDLGEGEGGGVLVDNRQWTAELGLLSFLRDVGKHVTVNQMLARESVKARLASEQGISFTEFSYMLLQANDYLWLHDHMGCELQVGGSDQWGNILSGVDLVRRVRGATVHALSWPLMIAADGTKLGKSTGARIWLDARRTSPYRFFQYWVNSDDSDVRRLLAQFTLLPVEEVDAIVADHAGRPEERRAQRRLASEVTSLVHGASATAAAEAASTILFGGSIADAPVEAVEAVAAEVPVRTVSRSALEVGMDLVDALTAEGLGLTRSKSEARRAIGQGGAYVNNRRAVSSDVVRVDDLLFGRWILLSRGRRSHAMLVVDDAP